jgi:transcriptional regulator with XRE-family HTH domain
MQEVGIGCEEVKKFGVIRFTPLTYGLDNDIANCNNEAGRLNGMDLATKLKTLRTRAGETRGLHRPLTQAELARAIREETGNSISQGYLSQLENGKRTHLTTTTREQLARFFRVHPGYLVNDPEGSPHEAVGLPFHLHHDLAHHTLARLAVHPHKNHLWPLINLMIDLPVADLEALHERLNARAGKSNKEQG